MNEGRDHAGPDDAPRALGRRVVAWIGRHPLLVTAGLVSISALVCALWIWNTRHLGAYDPDESGYLANALAYQRASDPFHPSLLWEVVNDRPTAPLVPLLSVITLTIGPRDVRSALLLQPILLVVLGVAVAGITRRLAGSGWAIVAGITVAGLPSVVLASTSYWFGLATATACALAVWALLASERLTNGWTWVFGVALGAVPLCRTMALGFVPGIVLAAVLLAGWDRRRLVRLGLALVVAMAVALPWWWSQHEAIWRYLFDYGYGERSAGWGESSLSGRVWSRLHQTLFVKGDMPVLVLTVLTVVILAQRWRTGSRLRPLTPVRREAFAVAVAAGVGMVALLSPRNSGVWFELPVQVLAIPLAVAIVARVPWPSVTSAVALVLVVAAVANPVTIRLDREAHIHGALPIYDSRFGKHGTEKPEVAEEWWQVNQDVARALKVRNDARSDGLFMTGNSFLVNTNTIDLAAEVDNWSSRLGVVDSFDGADIEGQLDHVRFLVVVRRDWVNFTPDKRWRRVDAAARRARWVERWSRSMPGGGEVVVLAPPEPDPAPGG